MNYRHAFHAGNVGDCLKHALLVWLVRALQQKPGAIAVLDTHAGIGRYDLAGGPATRTGEWRAGIARLLDRPPAPLAGYVALVRADAAPAPADALPLYPGSPVLIRAMLRPQDRLMCCELHPEDHATLRREFGRDAQVAVHRRDGYEALGALLPPGEKRGLVLIDPPYEATDEYERVTAGLRTALVRFPTGVHAAWYPIKHRAPVRAFHAALQQAGLRDMVAAELLIREPLDASRLNGCGLLVVNPPYRFEQEARGILEALVSRLGTGEPGQGFAITRLADE